MRDDTPQQPLTDEALKAAHARLNSEKPTASQGFPLTPIFQIGVFATMAFVAGVYLIHNSGKFSNSSFTTAPAAAEAAKSPLEEFQAIVKKGEQQYAICAACHQPTGQGLPGAFPPLAGSEWVHGDPARMVKVILSGIGGPITVKGANFASAMPSHAQLSDKDIAAIATFVRTNEKWGNKASIVSEKEVAEIRAKTAHPAAWTPDELLKLHPLGDEAKFPFVAPGGAPADAHGATPAGAHGAESSATPAGPDPAVLAKGKTVYATICQACHQPNGKGLPAVFPPLAGSEWLHGDAERSIAIVLKGMMGAVEVSGGKFNSVMTAQEGVLTDRDIAAVLTYVRAGEDFGNKLPPVSAEQVKAAREKFKAKAGMWNPEELLKLYPLAK